MPRKWMAAAALVAAGAIAAAATAGPAHADVPTSYNFTTLDSSNDLSFNQLLGLNDQGVIAGYFGSGLAGHPNKGYYVLAPRYSQLDYRTDNFPASAQTQVTGLTNGSAQVGFYAPTNTGTDANYGWYSLDNGRSFSPVSVALPAGAGPASPPVTQLLGVNDHDVAVGFEADSAGNAHGFTYSLRTGQAAFTAVAGAASVTDAAVNDQGQVAGFFTAPATTTPAPQTTEGFVTTRHGTIVLAVPGAASTMALGLNNWGEVVGTYTVAADGATAMHGFTWTKGAGFVTGIDDPAGVGTTTVNGVNDRGDLVGFYVDGQGNTDGMLAVPSK